MLTNGAYITQAGSIVRISGKHSGIAEVDFDWLEEDACIDCKPNPYPEDDGDSLILTWSCNYCSGGHATLIPLARCSRCGQEPGDIEERYSYGVYAGRLCRKCCLEYRDHCGIDGRQGQPEELEAMGETYWED